MNINKLLHSPNVAGQSLVDRVTAAKHSLAGERLAKFVCKATTEEPIPPKKKHIDREYTGVDVGVEMVYGRMLLYLCLNLRCNNIYILHNKGVTKYCSGRRTSVAGCSNLQ